MLNLKTAVSSRKSAPALDTARKFEKALITNKVTARFSNSLATSISCTSFSRLTAVSRLKQYLWLMSLLCVGIAQAADNVEMRAKIESILPDASIDSIQPLDNTGLVEVVIDGEVLYFSEDARYVFQGDVISLETRLNLTEIKRVKMKKQILASLNEADLIVFEPKKTEHTLTIFTDIDCTYCRKLHQQIDAYNDLGIRIRYMAFPRTGIDSESYEKAVDVWCAKDRQQAMTDSKQGKTVEAKSCDNPVKAHYEMGQRLGVRGTPALFLESGELLPGYIPPARLKQELDKRALLGKL